MCRSGSSPRAVVFLLLAAQSITGCALRGTGGGTGPGQRDLVSVSFAEPRAVAALSGDHFRLLSLVGRIERDSVDAMFVRIADATDVEGRSTAPLVGKRVRIGEYRSETVSVLRRDRSRGTVAVITGVPVLAFLVGFVLGRGQ